MKTSVLAALLVLGCGSQSNDAPPGTGTGGSAGTKSGGATTGGKGGVGGTSPAGTGGGAAATAGGAGGTKPAGGAGGASPAGAGGGKPAGAGGAAAGSGGGGATAGSGGAPTADPAGVFHADGTVDGAVFKAMALAYGTAAMIPFRFGKDWTGYHPTDPSLLAPAIWERPHVPFQLEANHYEHGRYELGVPSYSQTEPGDFSSAIAQVGYVTDPSIGASRGGLDTIGTYDQTRHVLAQSPQVAWVYNSGFSDKVTDPGNGLDPTIGKGSDQASKLVALTRPYGNSEEATHAFAMYQSGYMALLQGANTDSASYLAQILPPHLVPTSAGVTSQGEFALVPCWDTATTKGVLAVVALGEKHPTGSYFDLPWSELYPGFRNSGEWTFAKYLGAIDLGIVAPTEVEAVADDFGWAGRSQLAGVIPIQGQSGPGTSPISKSEAFWSSFKTNGDNHPKFAHHGFALVASRYERKVVLVDLTPLFAKVEAMMFSDFAGFVANVVDGSGMAPNQWPYAFDFDATWAPKVVKTLSFSSEVSAVSTSLADESKALVATEDGVLHVIDVDGLQSGGAGVNASEITSLPLGKNATAIGHVRHYPSANQLDEGAVQRNYWVLSRGDKRADLVSFKSGWTTPVILKTLRDARLVDPIGLDDNSNHGVELDLLNVADYGAKHIHAYRYGVVKWITWLQGSAFGCGEAASAVNVNPYCDGTNGTSAFEYGGGYETPTGTWVINGQNVQ